MKHNKHEPIVPNRQSLSYPSRTLDPPFDLVDRAKEIEVAEDSLKSHVSAKMEVIVQQIRSLQQQAQLILDQAKEDLSLHLVKCNFEKKIGQSFYLYQKENQMRYFSLLSPQDWKGSPPHQFLGKYRLRQDNSFESLETDSKF